MSIISDSDMPPLNSNIYSPLSHKILMKSSFVYKINSFPNLSDEVLK